MCRQNPLCRHSGRSDIVAQSRNPLSDGLVTRRTPRSLPHAAPARHSDSGMKLGTWRGGSGSIAMNSREWPSGSAK